MNHKEFEDTLILHSILEKGKLVYERNTPIITRSFNFYTNSGSSQYCSLHYKHETNAHGGIYNIKIYRGRYCSLKKYLYFSGNVKLKVLLNCIKTFYKFGNLAEFIKTLGKNMIVDFCVYNLEDYNILDKDFNRRK